MKAWMPRSNGLKNTSALPLIHQKPRLNKYSGLNLILAELKNRLPKHFHRNCSTTSITTESSIVCSNILAVSHFGINYLTAMEVGGFTTGTAWTMLAMTSTLEKRISV